MDIKQLFKEPEIQDIHTEWTEKYDISLQMLRLDNIHPEISGNKWYKLKENISLAKETGKTKLLTFGGIWSNHLAATAAAVKALNMSAIAYVRGLDEINDLTPTMQQCREYGMQLYPISRSEYRKRYEPEFVQTIKQRHPDCFYVPEGGNNELGKIGAEEIAKWIPDNASIIALAVGTGTTLAGVLAANHLQQTIWGYAPFKEVTDQVSTIKKYCIADKHSQFHVFSDQKWKGFGKYDSDLIDFMNQFYTETSIPLDIIYTAKMMFYLKEQIIRGSLPKNSKVLSIHSGGLQGNVSVKDRLVWLS